MVIVLQCWAFLLGTALVRCCNFAVAESFHGRKLQLLQRNPLYGRRLLPKHWPLLQDLIVEARSLPVSPFFHIACLVQGEQDISDMEQAFWASGADVFKLTFDTSRLDALFFPSSNWAEGRNFLLAAAAAVEIAEGHRYTYYAYLDADTYTSDWTSAWSNFTDFLRFWEPAIGVPGIVENETDIRWSSQNDMAGAISVQHFDQMMVAVHTDASPQLLPYRAELDSECWWVSSWRMSSLANAIYSGHVLLSQSFLIQNRNHGSYRRSECFRLMQETLQELRSEAPVLARTCFVPLSDIFLDKGGQLVAFSFHNSLYRPSQRPLRRADAELGHQDYSRMNLSTASCRDNLPEQQEESRWSWCMGCTFSAAFVLLQTIVASRPSDFVTWIKLANFLSVLAESTEGLLVAQVALAIGLRLGRCINGVNAYHLNWNELQDFQSAMQKFGLHNEPTSMTLKQIEHNALERIETIYNGVRAALTPIDHAGRPVKCLLSEESLKRFVDQLIGCDQRVDDLI